MGRDRSLLAQRVLGVNHSSAKGLLVIPHAWQNGGMLDAMPTHVGLKAASPSP